MQFRLIVLLLFVVFILMFNGSSNSALFKNEQLGNSAGRIRTKTSTSEQKLISKTQEIEEKSDSNENDVKYYDNSEKKTTVVNSATTAKFSSSSLVQTPECSPPSINDFPKDLFTQTQRRFGGVIFHFGFTIYLFFAITKVCDDYFMSSLDIISQKLNLDQDVAGATFMAAGSSAPEVFISLISIFISESSNGIGPIVGSAVFNILFVIGFCGLFISNTAKLTVWPFIRDSCFYFISILLLVFLIRDNKVYWYESFILLVFYGLYIFFMMNNDRFKVWAYSKFHMIEQETKNILPEGSGPTNNKQYGIFSQRSLSRSQSGYNRFSDEDPVYSLSGTNENILNSAAQFNQSYQNQIRINKMGIEHKNILNADSFVASNTRQIDFSTTALLIMMDKRYFRPRTRFQMAVRRVIDEIQWIKKNSKYNIDYNNFDFNPLNTKNYELFLFDKPNLNEPFGKYNFAKWVVFMPVKVILHFTIPDCRIEKYKKYYIVSFLVSILWLAFLSYLIVWMITVIGYTLGIPDSLMSVTFIAAGTSIPDAYTSIIVVKEGMVDMGVSNIVGSNVFDLLIGLAFPWFIKSIFHGGYVKINSNGIVYDALLLIACVVVTIFVIHFRKWHLDRRSGYVFLSIYSAFLIFSVSIELNLFSYVNPPMC